jgi:hypothetical protein
LKNFVLVNTKKIFINLARLTLKFLQIFPQSGCFAEKGIFEHKLTLCYILHSFIHAKWTKFKPTFARTFNEILQLSSKKILKLNLLVKAKFYTV